MSTKPTIGITRCSKLEDYVASIEQAGARARILEVSEDASKVLQQIDGVLLTGGGDVDPVFYREDRGPEIHDAEPGRDEFEIDLVKRAMAADIPVLGICRGSQVMNVAAGGTLIQDIPTAVRSDLRHSIKEPKNTVAHDVSVTPGSRLERVLGSIVDGNHACRVNSRHHQSVGQLGAGLVASAVAADGVVEAIETIEGENGAFCLGVQWHPENFVSSGEFSPLFEAFVDAARKMLERRRIGDSLIGD